MSTPSTTRRGIRRCGTRHSAATTTTATSTSSRPLQVALAFRSIALPTEHQQGLYRAVAAILHLGNVTFSATDDDACAVGDASALGAAADFLGVAYATFEEALTSRTMQSMSKSIYKIPLKASEAVRSAAAA